MLTIGRYSIDNQGDAFNRILLDTEPFDYPSSLDRFFREEFIVKKTWIGKTDQKRSEFEIMRTKVGIFKTGVSMTKICGQLTPDKTRIEIKIKPRTLTVINTIWVTFFLGLLLVNFFNNWIWWVALTGLTLIQLLVFLLDYRATEEKFTDYINSLRSNALQQSL